MFSTSKILDSLIEAFIATRMNQPPRVIYFVAFVVVISVYYMISIKINVFNLRLKAEEPLRFGNILRVKAKPENGKNVFFIESGSTTGHITLRPRQACSVESAAFTNPNSKIFLLFTSRERLKNLTITSEVEALLSYPNVYINYINANEFSVGTPFEKFFKEDVLSQSSYKVEHTADVLRFMVLWKYGGNYLDTDVIARMELDKLANYACPESPEYVNTAIMNFEGHETNKLIEIFINDMISNFNGHSWGHNGPIMMTRVLQRLCNVTSTTEMVDKGNCLGFHVLDMSFCYPIGGMQAYDLIYDDRADDAMAKVANSLAVHFWNHVTNKMTLKKNQTAAYVQIAHRFCPRVMAAGGEFF